MSESKHEKSKNKLVKKIMILILVILIFAAIFFIAQKFVKNDTKSKINLIINNKDVTAKLKKEVFIENDVIYVSIDDLKNFFDKYILYDKERKEVRTTSDTKVAVLKMDEKKIKINGSTVKIRSSIVEKNDTIYLPFSEMKNVYNIDINHIIKTNIVTVDSLDREFIKADVSKNVSVKYKPKNISKAVDKIKKGDRVVAISTENGWTKIRTENGKLGYVKENVLANFTTVRQNLENTKKIDGKVNLVWDYYSEYKSAPDRSGKIDGINVVSPAFFLLKKEGNGEIDENVGDAGIKYINWAHNNNYQVWAIFSNNSYLTTTSNIMNDASKRETLIDNIVNLAVKYEIDGINLDFENMKKEDKDLYSRFIIELQPRLKECGLILSVDVTAPDGGETWSLCFDRNIIGDVADYIVFMAYDQYGLGRSKAGTTSGYNWVKNNINKFLGQEGVEKEKIILGLPFYTRIWTEKNGEVTSKILDMKDIDDKLPSDVNKIWDDSLKQDYVEYTDKNGDIKKIWIEDEKSLKEKIGLVTENNLAGVAFWAKDKEKESIWNMIDQELNK